MDGHECEKCAPKIVTLADNMLYQQLSFEVLHDFINPLPGSLTFGRLHIHLLLHGALLRMAKLDCGC